MNQKNKIFLLEDDQSFGSVLKSYLEINDYYVRWVDDGKKAISTFRDEVFSICILDVMLPNVDGFSVARDIKLINPDIPFVFLTAKTLKDDILEGFKIGADDYITKPFDSEVLLCKINAIISRNAGTPKDKDVLDNILRIGSYTFNREMRTLSLRGEEKRISPKEADLLLLLIEYNNKVMPREKALKTIWGDDNYFTTRSMDVYITKLRKYLKKDTSINILNIHGSGYRLIVEE